jgi:hypothetical protein
VRCRRLLSAEHGGFAPAEFALAVGLWLFPLTVLVVTLPLWVERQSLARVAAQETARVVVVADTIEQGAAAGQALLDRLAANHGVAPADVSLEVRGTLRRGAVVQTTVAVRVPALRLPALGDAASFTVTSSHREAVDQYRGFVP